MKILVLAVWLAVSQAPAPVPRKAPDNATGTSRPIKSQPEAKQAPSAPTAAIGERIPPKEEKDFSNDVGKNDTQEPIRVSELPSMSVERDWVDHITWLSTLLLVLVGSGGIWVALKTLKTVNTQAGIMQRQTEATEIAANAARDTARATRDTLEMLISKERANLTIEVKNYEIPAAVAPLTLLALRPFPFFPSVKFDVIFYGLTPAIIQDSASEAQITDSEKPPSDRIIGSIWRLPKIIKPDTPPIEDLSAVLCSDRDQDTVDAIKGEKKFIHFRAFIRYKDVFGHDREIRIARVLRVYPSSFEEGKFNTYWSTGSATPEDNKQT